MATLASGLGNATQNVGLYNLYNQRSYPCTVISLGNAMIQPTMYFNLRHVPMFNGPYMIQEVTHTITPGSFQTQFNGIRQAVFDYPQIDKYLQSINQNLLTKVEALIKNSSEKPSIPPTTDQGKGDKKPSDSKKTPSPENSCVNNVNLEYQNNQFVSTLYVKTSVTPEQMITSINDILIKKNVTDMNMKAILYSICYVTTYQENNFIAGGNNYSAAINLTVDFSPTYKEYFEKTYMCTKIKGTDYPMAVFSSRDKFLEFLYERVRVRKDFIEKEGLWLFYNCAFPNTKTSISESAFYSGRTTNSTIKQIGDKLTAGLNSFNQLVTNTTLGIQQIEVEKLIKGTVQTNNPEKQNNPTNNQGTSTSGQPKCSPPTIISFKPKEAKTSGPLPPITLSGTNLYGNTKVYLNDKEAQTTKITNTEITFNPPKTETGKIKIVTSGGTTVSVDNFVFINNSSATTTR
jgi:hypothetical protein